MMVVERGENYRRCNQLTKTGFQIGVVILLVAVTGMVVVSKPSRE